MSVMVLPLAAEPAAPTAEQRKKVTMHDAHRAAASVGPQLTRRALLEGGVTLGLAAAGSLAWPFDTSPRARAMAGAGSTDWAAFDRAIETATQRFGIVGTAVAIVNGAGLEHQQMFGVRDLATAAPVTPDTLFRVGSTTKSMSALLVAQFVDEGLLGWDQPVREVWPAFRAPTAELTGALRVRDLFGMATGLGAQPITDVLQGYATPRRVLESIAFLPVLGPPHTQFFYDNTMCSVGGYLPALALGTDPDELLTVYSRLMQERVYGPVGMATARIADDPRAFSDYYATGYAPDFEQGMAVESWAPVGSFAPVGGTVASLTDMAAYVTMQLRGGTTTTDRRVVSAEHLAECWKPGIEIPITPSDAPGILDLSYCMGWTLAHYDNGRHVISHTGGVDGFTCIMAFLPDEDLGLVVLTNVWNAPAGLPFCTYVLNLLLEQRVGLAADTNAALVSAYHDAAGQLADQAAQALPVDSAAITPFLGYYEEGFILAFDAMGTLRLHVQNRAWRVLGQPDGSYVLGSGLPAGITLKLTRDAVGVPQLELQDVATVRWQSGLG
jgi:CubicO group peptidase (beta-lactamase class C family)